MDDCQIGVAGIVGDGDDLEFDSTVIHSHVQQLVPDGHRFAGIRHCGETDCVTHIRG